MKAKTLAAVLILIGCFVLAPGMLRAEGDEWYQGQQGQWQRQGNSAQWKATQQGDQWYQGRQGHWYQERDGWQYRADDGGVYRQGDWQWNGERRQPPSTPTAPLGEQFRNLLKGSSGRWRPRLESRSAASRRRFAATGSAVPAIRAEPELVAEDHTLAGHLRIGPPIVLLMELHEGCSGVSTRRRAQLRFSGVNYRRRAAASSRRHLRAQCEWCFAWFEHTRATARASGTPKEGPGRAAAMGRAWFPHDSSGAASWRSILGLRRHVGRAPASLLSRFDASLLRARRAARGLAWPGVSVPLPWRVAHGFVGDVRPLAAPRAESRAAPPDRPSFLGVPISPDTPVSARLILSCVWRITDFPRISNSPHTGHPRPLVSRIKANAECLLRQGQ